MAIHNKSFAFKNNIDNAVNNFGHKNIVMNGCFDVWQRGTSFTNCTNTNKYTADRWVAGRNGWVTGCNVARALRGNVWTARVQRAQGNTSTASLFFGSSFETQEVYKYRGHTYTIQFKSLKGSNFSEASSALTLKVYTGTGTDGAPGDGITGAVAVVSQSFTLTTSIANYSTTFTLPNNVTQLIFDFEYVPVGTAGVDDWFEIGDVQIEMGSTATSVEKRQYAMELAMCQRYYEQWDATSGRLSLGTVANINTTTAYGSFKYTQKRIVPTITTSGTFRTLGPNQGGAITIGSFDANIISCLYTGTGSGFVAGQSNAVESDDSSTAKIFISADL